ncbi:MAG: hypothetical protein GY765_01890, partial [bacterium]|nr:hypothetical protein [bacterium]
MREKIEIVGSVDELELRFLFTEVQNYLDDVYIDMVKALGMRKKNSQLDLEATMDFFRSKERVDIIRIVLQYLVYYLREVDINHEKKDAMLKPFLQFRESIIDLFDLLLED